MKSRSLVWVVLVSLGLNLFLGGFLLMRWQRGSGRSNLGQHEKRKRPPGPFRLREVLKDQPGFEERLKAERQRMKPARKALRRSQRDIERILSAETLDTAALNQALTQLRAAVGETQGEMHRLLLEVAPTLSAEQRRSLMERNRVTRRRP